MTGAAAGGVPLSLGQQALWFFQHMSPRSSAYHVPLAFRLTGPLRVDLLHAALDTVVRRHETLRTAFRQESDGEPYQVVLEPGAFDLPVHDLSTAAEAVEKTVADIVRTPFVLADGTPLRAAVLRTGPDEHVFVLVAHHIVSDGWSLRLMTDEISAAYRALGRGAVPEAELPALDVQYTDYALWQRDGLAMPEQEEALAYWERALAGVPTLDLADGRSRPRRPTYAADRLLAEVDPGVAAALHEHAKATGTSLFSLLAAAFTLAVHERTARTDIAFGTMLAGRVEPELEPLVGYFVNTVVLRVDLSDAPSPHVLADRLGAAMLGAIDHEAPFGSVVERLNPPRRPGRNPIYQVTMQLRTGGSAPGVLELPGITAHEIDVYQGQHAFDLTLTFIDSTAGLTISVEYSTEVFDRVWASDLAAQLVRILQALPEGTHD